MLPPWARPATTGLLCELSEKPKSTGSSSWSGMSIQYSYDYFYYYLYILSYLITRAFKTVASDSGKGNRNFCVVLETLLYLIHQAGC